MSRHHEYDDLRAGLVTTFTEGSQPAQSARFKRLYG
jgi:hypothetical protein